MLPRALCPSLWLCFFSAAVTALPAAPLETTAKCTFYYE